MKKLLHDLLPAYILMVIGLHCANQVAGTTDETESGTRIYGQLVEYTEGKPVADAVVRLYRNIDSTITIDGSRPAVSSVDSTLTDSVGRYAFDSIAAGHYNMEAYYITDGDTLRVSRVGIDHADVLQAASGTYVGIDTLKMPGMISGTLTFDQNNKSEVFVYIPGTSFLAITDDDGNFTIFYVPPGSYTVAYWRFGYEKVNDSGVVVRSGETTTLEEKTLVKLPDAYPLYPVGVEARYDFLSGVVTVTWSPVEADSTAGYIVFRKDSAKTGLEPRQVSGDKIVIDTLFRDTLSDDLFVGADTMVLQYQVQSRNIKEDRSPYSEPAFIKVYTNSKNDTIQNDTSVLPDTLFTDTTLAADTVVINSNVVVENGVTLKINPGTVMLFQSTSQKTYALIVKGRLLAEGTESDSIIFTPAIPNYGWNGIRFAMNSSSDDTSKITFCRLEGGNLDLGGALSCTGISKLVITKNTFENNSAKTYGGAIYCQTSSPVISANTFNHNRATAGGAVCCNATSNPLIENNKFIGNEASEYGGAIFCANSEPHIKGNIITKNKNGVVSGYGGGIYCKSSNMVIQKNEITDNETYFEGGGIYSVSCSGNIRDNMIKNNSASGNESYGGGIYSAGSLEGGDTIIGNTISYNSAVYGGGFYGADFIGEFKNNNISKNTATYGGGIYLSGNTGLNIINCSITLNVSSLEGGGIYGNSTFYVINTTMAKNYAQNNGGSVYHTGIDTLYVFNTIAWGNNAVNGPQFYLGENVNTEISSSCIQGGGFEGNGNIDQYPMFSDTANGDFSLLQQSPCINAGVNGLLPEGIDYDIAGNARIIGDTIDMGAYENY